MSSLDAFVEAYEAAQNEGSANLADFLPERQDPLYGAVLCELVRVDMEYSWKRGQPRWLEEYRMLYPGLFCEGHALQSLAFEEYRLRHQAGQHPSPAEYRERFRVDPDSWPRMVRGISAESPAASRGVAWETLERLLRDLHHSDRSEEQIRLALDALRDSVDADVVFHWYAEGASAPLLSEQSQATPEWCQTFAQRALDIHGTAQGQLLLPPLALPALVEGPSPRSAMLVRVGRKTAAWIGAVSFKAGQRFGATDLKIVMLARRMLLGQREYTQTYAKLKDTLFSLIRCLTAMIDARDPNTSGHSERVARIAVRLGKEIGLPPRVQSDLYLAGLLHDIGKIGIRDDVLLKQGALSPEEIAHMREHVLIGDRIVTTVKQLASLRDGVRSHHERIDGKGYPDGHAGKNIPLLGRVLAIADACDAMMSARPYRPAMPTHQIDAIMAAGAGSQWDAEMIGHFLACRHDLYAICQRGLGHSVLHAVENVLDQRDQRLGLSDVGPLVPDGEGTDT